MNTEDRLEQLDRAHQLLERAADILFTLKFVGLASSVSEISLEVDDEILALEADMVDAENV